MTDFFKRRLAWWCSRRFIPWHHCTGLSLTKRLFFLLCHPTPLVIDCTVRTKPVCCHEAQCDIEIHAVLNGQDDLLWQPAWPQLLYDLREDVFRCNCGQAENESRASVYSRVIIEAGSCSHPGLTSTANVLFVKLLYFRAVLLLGNLSLTSYLQRERQLTFLVYSPQTYECVLISSAP